MTDLEPGIYHACPVCDAKAEVEVQAIDGTTERMPCPACREGLVPHQCSSSQGDTE